MPAQPSAAEQAAASSSAAADSNAVVAKRPAIEDDWSDLAKRRRTRGAVPVADARMAERPEDVEMRAALMALGDASVDVVEVFSPGRFTEKTGAFDLRPGLALDLRTGWNLSEPATVAKA